MRQYFYSDGESQFGPYTYEELSSFDLSPDTLIWYPGLDTWVELKESDKLRSLLFKGKKPMIDLPEEQVPEIFQPNEPEARADGIPGLDNEGTAKRKPPKNWLLESILVTLLCCNPLAIVAIIYAAQVDTTFYEGDREKAEQFSSNAALWVRVAFGVSVIVAFFYFFILLFSYLSG